MPVAITIAAVMSLSRRPGTGAAPPFRDSEALRERIEQAVEAGSRLDAALDAIDGLERTIQAYDEQAEAAVYRYLRESRDFDMDPRDFDSDIFGDLERRRRDALHEVVAVREGLRDLLTPAEWEATFTD